MKKLFYNVSALCLLCQIAVFSVSGQQLCRWESFSAFQEKYSKEIKKSPTKGEENYLENISFIDEKRGWITGTNFTAATTDGGKSWKIKRVKPTIVNEIYFADESKGWHTIVGESSDVKIYQTRDGGKTWKYLKEISESFTVKADVRVFGYAPTILKVRFASETLVWSVGLKKVGDTLQYAIWKSADGGRTWETKYLSKDSVIQKTLEASFIQLTEKRLIISSNGVIFFSEDSGENWRETFNLNLSKTSIPDFFNDFEVVQDLSVWAVTATDGKILRSTDSGKTWLRYEPEIEDEDSYKFTSVKFSNRQTGWLAGSNSGSTTTAGIVLSTTNGGKNWTLAHRTAATEIITLSKTSKYLFAAGNNGLLLKHSIADCVN